MELYSLFLPYVIVECRSMYIEKIMKLSRQLHPRLNISYTVELHLHFSSSVVIAVSVSLLSLVELCDLEMSLENFLSVSLSSDSFV